MKSKPADALFERHLDLTRLRGQRRGLTLCPFHEDRTPSLSVDLDKLLFHCFGCGAGGGLKVFAKLLGERGECRSRPSTLPRPRPDRVARWQPLFDLSGFVKKCRDLVDRLRREATKLGPTEAAWNVLEEAVLFETAGFITEARIEEQLAAMRRR